MSGDEGRKKEPWRKRSGLLPALLVLLIGACLLWWSARSATRAPLSQEAYVWQRSWTAGVGEAAVVSVPPLSGLLCLAAELSVEEGTFRQRHIRVEHEAGRLRWFPEIDIDFNETFPPLSQ